MNEVISTRKMSSENTRRSRVFSGIFLVEMASFMFPSQCRDATTISYLFYKIKLEFSWRYSCLCTLIQNENDTNHVSVLWEKMRLVEWERALDACYFIKHNKIVNLIATSVSDNHLCQELLDIGASPWNVKPRHGLYRSSFLIISLYQVTIDKLMFTFIILNI